MALEETSGVGAQVAEFVDFDPSLEAEDAFDVGEWEAVALEKPEAEQLVIKAALFVSLKYKGGGNGYKPDRPAGRDDGNEPVERTPALGIHVPNQGTRDIRVSVCMY